MNWPVNWKQKEEIDKLLDWILEVQIKEIWSKALTH